ncbi:MAG: ABC transporter permease [Gammaproteobacteria bacterium]|nr:ABC transporter permease [Gammaproteobacteria bacterium]
MSTYYALLAWQSWAILGRHVRVHLRKWHTALLPPVCEPLILLLAFGIGLGRQMGTLRWSDQELDYLAYLAPGMLAYTSFMTSFFQSLFSAYVRMHYQKAWEGQLTTQVRLEHVIWGEVLWAAGMATAYVVMVCVVLAIFGAMGLLQLHWWALPLLVPLLMLGALAFATVGLLFTALLPSMDHMGLPFFLVIMPIAFISSTYFPLPDSAWLGLLAVGNPLHHLAEAARHLLVNGEPTRHLLYAPLLCLLMLAVLMPLDMHVLRRRVFGDH